MDCASIPWNSSEQFSCSIPKSRSATKNSCSGTRLIGVGATKNANNKKMSIQQKKTDTKLTVTFKEDVLERRYRSTLFLA